MSLLTAVVDDESAELLVLLGVRLVALAASDDAAFVKEEEDILSGCCRQLMSEYVEMERPEGRVGYTV